LSPFTKDSLVLHVDRRLESGDVIAVLDKTVEEYGVPEFIRSDYLAPLRPTAPATPNSKNNTNNQPNLS
jgi:hypothetical protein